MHPIAVRVHHDVESLFAPRRLALDEELFTRLYRNNPRYYQCQSSDELGVYSLSVDDGDPFQSRPPLPVIIGVLAEFAGFHAGLARRELHSQEPHLIANNIEEKRWRAVENEATRAARQTERCLAVPDCVS